MTFLINVTIDYSNNYICHEWPNKSSPNHLIEELKIKINNYYIKYIKSVSFFNVTKSNVTKS